MNRTSHHFLAICALAVLLALPAVGFAQKDPAPSSPGTTVTDPKGGTTQPLSGQPTTAQAQQSNGGFVSLTGVRGLQEAGRPGDFAGLLNNLYLLCVGAGAILAVLQILRGGLTYMLSDSVTNKKEARDTIVMALVGLLLVLSPTIVFGIIDPRILSLQVNFSGIRPSTEPDPTDRNGLPVCVINGQSYPPIQNGRGVSSAAEQQCCLNQGYTLVPVPNVPGSFTCYATPPQSNPQDDPGGSGQTQVGGTTYYYREFPIMRDDYVALLGITNSEEGCFAVAFGSFPDQAACQEALSQAQASRESWTAYESCRQISYNDYVPVQSTTPICENVETIGS